MRSSHIGMGLLLAVACGAAVQAGPLRDALRTRAQARQGGGELDEADAERHQGSLPGAAEIHRDLAYGADARQRVDVYRPAAAAQPAPLLVMVHGGGWRRGDKALASVVRHKGAHWLQRGGVFVSVNYRMLPDADPLQQADDVARALAFVQQHAGEWGGDPGRVVLAGHSAGAHLVALLAAAPEIARNAGAKPWLGTLALDSAGYDVEQVMSGRHMRLYDQAFGSDPAFWRQASPLARLQSAPAPMLLVCSTPRADACPQARAFAAKVQGLGGRAQVLPEALSHRQINDTLGEPGAYTDAIDAFVATLAPR